FSSRRRHTRFSRDWSSDVCSSDLDIKALLKSETWMTGREAVEAGFADQLTEPPQAAAQLSSKRMQEINHMPEALKTLMQPRAQATTPPPGANRPAAPAAPANQPAAPSEADIRAQMQAAETQRRESISAVFTGSFAEAHAELLNACLLDMNCTPEQAKDKLLAKL